MKRENTIILYVCAACLLVFSGLACHSSDSYVGTYQAVDTDEEPPKENFIELMENGEGFWACCDGEVPFTWYVKGSELRINTKEGGIMVGKLKKDSFTIQLPGKKMLSFAKIPSQG